MTNDLCNDSPSIKDLICYGEAISPSTKVAQASTDQTQGVEEVNQAITQIDQTTQMNTASAEESFSAAEDLAWRANQLEGMLKAFRLDLNDSLQITELRTCRVLTAF